MNVHFAVSLILLGLILPTQYVLGHEESPIVALIPTSDEPGAHNMTEICPETLSDRNNLTTGAIAKNDRIITTTFIFLIPE